MREALMTRGNIKLTNAPHRQPSNPPCLIIPASFSSLPFVLVALFYDSAQLYTNLNSSEVPITCCRMEDVYLDSLSPASKLRQGRH
jgi:hypothetical protein